MCENAMSRADSNNAGLVGEEITIEINDLNFN